MTGSGPFLLVQLTDLHVNDDDDVPAQRLADAVRDVAALRPAPDAVLVRDSKNRTGPTLTVPTPAWRAFLTTVAH